MTVYVTSTILTAW